MKPIEFEEANVRVAEDQDQYETLPAYWDELGGTLTSCWELSQEELEEVKSTGKIFLVQETRGRAMQPIRLTTERPF